MSAGPAVQDILEQHITGELQAQVAAQQQRSGMAPMQGQGMPRPGTMQTEQGVQRPVM